MKKNKSVIAKRGNSFLLLLLLFSQALFFIQCKDKDEIPQPKSPDSDYSETGPSIPPSDSPVDEPVADPGQPSEDGSSEELPLTDDPAAGNQETPLSDDPRSPNNPEKHGNQGNKTVYTVKPTESVIDGDKLNLTPGSVIKIEGGTRGALLIKNITGTRSSPIVIVNATGKTTIQSSGAYGLKTENCRYFRVSGAGTGSNIGFVIDGGHIGMSFDHLSSDFEVDHIEVKNSGFAGIMAKTDPSCDKATWRGNFMMENLKFHNNYVHDVQGEGFYIGNSFYASGRNLDCGNILPHEIKNVEVFNNHIKNSGCEGIQAGCVVSGLKISGNTVENFGISPFADAQNNGVQIGEGSSGIMYNNIIKKGPGNGIIVLGMGNIKIYNNLVENPGSYGAFVDNRGDASGDISFIHNTFINPGNGGIKTYNELVKNRFINNIIAGTREFFIYGSSATGEEINNLTKENLNDCGFVNPSSGNYKLSPGSPAVDAASNGDVSFGLARKKRPSGSGYDIGAYEL